MKTARLSTGTKGKNAAPAAHRILVPTDFSACSVEAIRFALEMPKAKTSEIILLNVIETYPVDYVVGLNETRISSSWLEESVMDQLERLTASLKPDPAALKVLVRSGQPWREVCRAAEDLQAALIIIGSHGRKGIERLYFGSTAERVVRHAPCPVLVVRKNTKAAKTAKTRNSREPFLQPIL